MEATASQSKDVLLATRVTPHIRDLVQTMATKHGLYVSEWMRLLIVNELNRKKMLN
jgi:hypothetical protein